MKIELQEINGVKIGEIISDDIIIGNVEDGIDLLGNLYYQNLDKVILHQKNITPAFFDLKTRIAGEILQKFTTYGLRLAIVGDFSNVKSKSLNDFIFESNKGRQVNFTESVAEALNRG